MAEMLFKETRYQVKQLVSDIELGRLALPELQRPFVWKKSKVRDLFDSMYRGFPVGYILLWNTSAHVASKQMGTGEKQDAPTRFIVDGQQRLTSIYSVFTGTEVTNNKFATERIRIAFRPNDGRFEVADAATERGCPPLGITGVAPGRIPPLATGGAEKAVRSCGASQATSGRAALAVRCIGSDAFGRVCATCVCATCG